MTECDQLARPPDAPPDGPEWKPIRGARDYESSHRGKVRSLDRTKNGRFYPGIVLKPREDGDGYLMFNYTDDDGKRHHNVSVARITLLTHDPDGYREGLHACHGPGGKHDNRYPENIRWDTPEANWKEALDLRMLNSPPKAKSLKVCVRCGAGFDTPGRRCRPCITWFSEQGAALIAGGIDLEQAARDLDYPSAVGLFRLAVKHGGLRCVVTPREDPAVVTLGDSRRWLRKVIGSRIRGGDAQ